MNHSRKWMIPVAALAIFCTCFSGCLSGCGPDTKEARAMMGMNPHQRRLAFASMPPNRQVDIYLAAALKFEPGKVFLDEVAVNWKTTLPAIKERLASRATSDAERTELLWLLGYMNGRYCSLATRQDVLALASEAVSRMDELHRSYAKEPLGMIFNGESTKHLLPCQ